VLRTWPLFQVQNVTITGTVGNADPEITATLQRTAREMTNDRFLNRAPASVGRRDNAVAGLRASTQFPAWLRIRVRQRAAVARVAYGGLRSPSRPMARRACRGRAVSLAALDPHRRRAKGGRVTDPVVREELALLAAAPPVLRAHVFACVHPARAPLSVCVVDRLSTSAARCSRTRSGMRQAVVLASGTHTARGYIDVSLPARPAAASMTPRRVAPDRGADARNRPRIATGKHLKLHFR